MSNWTHVAGVMRIDDFRFDESVPNFEKIFGKELRWEDDWPENEEEEKYLPIGSEGSLEMSVHVNEDIYCMAAYVVTIFGDLRDHDSPDEIINWFKEKCELAKNEFIDVRQAAIIVENEWNGTRIWSTNEEDKE